MILSKSEMGALRKAAQSRADRDIARTFRQRNSAEVSHLSDDELHAAVTEAREIAVNLGIKQSNLRMRFIMLGVFRLPRFWDNPSVNAMLTAKTGTADMRFGDVCALFKLSAQRSGKPNHVWW